MLYGTVRRPFVLHFVRGAHFPEVGLLDLAITLSLSFKLFWSSAYILISFSLIHFFMQMPGQMYLTQNNLSCHSLMELAGLLIWNAGLYYGIFKARLLFYSSFLVNLLSIAQNISDQL